MRGVLIVDKPAGFTSFDVIAKLRKCLNMKRIGHGGTLDPEATGVLVVYVGEAAKLSDYFPDSDKDYEAGMLLGTATDTEDIWGTVTETLPVNVTEEEVREVLESFVGPYLQTPPMVSAKKINGKKLYEYARKGLEIERKAEIRTVYALEVEEISLPRVRFKVSVSKGTYIRTLCTDAGKKLGLPCCMSALRRTRQGRFSIEKAHTLEEIEKASREGYMEKLLIPIEDLFGCENVQVKQESERLLLNGNALSAEDLEGASESFVKVFDRAGIFKGLYRFDPDKKRYLPEKMFPNN